MRCVCLFLFYSTYIVNGLSLLLAVGMGIIVACCSWLLSHYTAMIIRRALEFLTEKTKVAILVSECAVDIATRRCLRVCRAGCQSRYCCAADHNHTGNYSCSEFSASFLAAFYTRYKVVFHRPS